jgi:hypothetical protein
MGEQGELDEILQQKIDGDQGHGQNSDHGKLVGMEKAPERLHRGPLEWSFRLF